MRAGSKGEPADPRLAKAEATWGDWGAGGAVEAISLDLVSPNFPQTSKYTLG